MIDIFLAVLDAVIQAPWLIKLHVLSALGALAIGPVAIYRKRRDLQHRIHGTVWVTMMLFTAISSFWISTVPVFGPFGLIHAFSLYILISLWHGMRLAFQRRFKQHGLAMSALYWRGVVMATLIHFAPGRGVNKVLFSESPDLGYVVILAGVTLIIGEALWSQRNNRARIRPRSAY